MTADDVVASFRRLLQGGLPYAKDRFKHLDTSTKVNDRTVRFKLKQPDAGFLLNLGSRRSSGELGPSCYPSERVQARFACGSR